MTTYTARVNKRGQVVIPAEARKKYDIEPETNVLIREDEDGLHVVKPTEAYIRQRFVGLAPKTAPSAADGLLADRHAETRRDDAERAAVAREENGSPAER